MKTKERKVEFYQNGSEMLTTDFKQAKERISNLQKYRGKLNGYGPFTPSKATVLHEEIERFNIDEFEFVVVQYETMDLNFNPIVGVSKPYLATAIWWQRIK
jgi:hypothetical protein